MSQHLRGVLTTRLNRLRGYVEASRATLQLVSGGRAPSDEEVVGLRRNQRLIQDLLPKIEAKQLEWERLMAAIPEDEARNAEVLAYNTYRVDGLQFVEYLDTVDELVSQIGIVLEEVATATPAARSRTTSITSSQRVARLQAAIDTLGMAADAQTPAVDEASV
jgi:hypothetical protein